MNLKSSSVGVCDGDADGSSAFGDWKDVAGDPTDGEVWGGIDGGSKEECQSVLRRWGLDVL